MEITLTTAEVLQCMSSDTRANKEMQETTSIIRLPGGVMNYTHTAYRHFELLSGHTQTTQDLVLKTVSDLVSIEMQFNFAAPITFGETGQQELTAMSMHHNLLYYPGYEGQSKLAGQQHFRSFDIHVTPDFIFQWYGQSKVLDGFLHKVSKGIPAQLFPRYMPITPVMHSIINDIHNFSYAPGIRQLYIEAKVMELLSMQIDLAECMHHIGKKTNHLQLKSHDISCIHHAREHIASNLHAPCSIIELAHKVGINDFKLKNGFKQLFGTTIFEYMQGLRMEKAKISLLHTKEKISDIAEQVGYSNASNFTNAFKNHFGYAPKELRGTKALTE
ncbi:helix-turn-helix transcriptional regulator [Chitinophaga nivalis]|uniref:AraC family transcriptional regulator n=1 Tax=Chitinophaga nivalis TaxID=2991709 RepID=A0ABT3IVP5_9BACT|nr:AraC family transcriptional regulator [Chitinophaga nivalis]MCW3462545.1 AraC family transcriptional regulator [Chitinophaga nivalis]MCW3487764.1 AraC family transcriptional regulator [Chitinophaga nivalis]